VPLTPALLLAAYLWPGIGPQDDTIATRFAPPPASRRLAVPDGSFAAWLRGLPLRAGRPPVHLFDGRLKADQSVHLAVVDLDVGARDLQQSADVVERAGSRAFLLVQSYMPAQEIHVLRNPATGLPWFEAEPGAPLETPEWTFPPDALRRFPESVR
jgi:hypothetical protein